MPVSQLAYLGRYLFFLLLAAGTLKLFKEALQQIKARMSLSSTPISGYFLLMQPRPEWTLETLPPVAQIRQRDQAIRVRLPLYPTTLIGRGSAADLRFRLPSLPRQALTIYRDAGEWRIRRESNQFPLWINGQVMTGSHALRSRDQIAYGPFNLIFLDEREESRQAGLIYNEVQAEAESGHLRALTQAASSTQAQLALARTLAQKGSYLPYLTFNLFWLLGLGLQYLLFPLPDGGWLVPLARLQVIIGALLNGYFLILPKLTPQFDRRSYLIFCHLVVLGNLVQYRLHLVNRSQIDQARSNGAVETYETLLNYVAKQFLVQEVALLIGLVVFPLLFWVVAKTRWLERLVLWGLILTPGFYLATLLLGRDPGAHGARLWLQIGTFSIQLTELAKISYLLVLAGFFKIRPRLKMQLAFAAWAALNFFLIMLLPDLGSLIILLPVTLVVYTLMSGDYLKAGLLVLLGSAVGVVAYLSFPYIRRRLEGWTTLWDEVNPGNEQIVYGLQAVARGGLFGRGLGNGAPAGIPEAKGDMVYSVLIEEWGLLVGILIVVLFLTLWLRALYVATEAEDGFVASLALGAASLLFIEALVVIAGSTGLIPLTGATLPFIAQGGSSLLAKTILVALLSGLAARKNRYNAAEWEGRYETISA